jgi:hypothetical protein
MCGQAPDRRQRHVSPTDEEDLVTRIDTARDAAGRAREAAAQYAGEARDRIAPHLESAVDQALHAARSTVDERLAPRWEQARAHVPPTVGDAAARARDAAVGAAATAKEAATRAQEAAARAQEAASPLAHEAQLRGGAALAALRGHVSAEDIERLAARLVRRERRARALRRAAVVAAVAGGAAAAFVWWRRQSSPDWLVEPAGGESGGGGRPTSLADEVSANATGTVSGGVSDTAAMPLDPEVQAKAEDENDGEQ